MEKDSAKKITTLRVDGGACASELLMQTQADILGVEVERPSNIESTALGAAMLAGLGAGIWPDINALSAIRNTERRFEAQTAPRDRKAKLKTWKRAVKRAQKWETKP
jgi:glycerol kinase